jgi:hypothetical protein
MKEVVEQVQWNKQFVICNGRSSTPGTLAGMEVVVDQHQWKK